MLFHFFKTTWRAFRKQKLYSVINITGLALGMACSLLIALWVKDELAYDRFYPGYQQLYQVKYNGTHEGKMFTNPATPGPMAAALKAEVPGVAISTRISWEQDVLITVQQKAARETGIKATADFFKVFAVPMLDGNAAQALHNPSDIVITRRLAEKYFGTVRCAGQTLMADTNQFYTVAGVIENLPAQSTLQYDWVRPFPQPEPEWMQNWHSNAFRTFIKLQPGVTLASVEAGVKHIYDRHSENSRRKTALLQPLAHIHLYSEFENGKPSGGPISYVRIFTGIATFILLIACINFMNMTTARASIRTKETGVRKILGAARSRLFRQFLGEAFLNCLLALLVAFTIVQLCLPAFNSLLGKNIQLSLSPVLLTGVLLLLIITTLLSGIYPALLLSAKAPVSMLRNTINSRISAALFRKSLVVLQFTISIFLIIAILGIHRQLKYTREKNLGLDNEHMVYIPLEGRLLNQREAFRQQVLQSSVIASATFSSEVPAEINLSSSGLSWQGMDEKSDLNIFTATVGPDFLKTMNIPLAAGRDFASTSDTSGFVINETMAAILGPEALGKTLEFWGIKGPVLGIVKNFHYASLYQQIEPLILCYYPSDTRYMLVKLRGGSISAGLETVRKLYHQFNPQYPFTYHFTDEVYDRLYKSENITGTLVSYASILAIIISSLGLLGLSTFMAEQRRKEIGIRKVLGATLTHVITLLSGDFIVLIGIAFLIACPAGWLVMHKWLQTFAYKIQPGWLMFAVAGGIAVVIALITMSFQTFKAALYNPVHNLRAE